MALRKLLAFLRRGIAESDDVAELTLLIVRTLDVQGVSFGPGFGFSRLVHVRNVDEDWRAFHTRHQSDDPSPAFLDRSGGLPFRVMTDSTPAQRRMPLHRGLVRFGFADAAVTRYDGLGVRHYMAVYRERGAHTFDDDDALLAQLLEPHITRSLGTGLATAAIRGGADAPIPVGWVDLPGRTFHPATDLATALLVHLGLETEHARSRFAAMLIDRASRHANAPPPLVVSVRHRLEGAIVDPKRSGPRTRREIAQRVFFALCPRPPNATDDDLLWLLTPSQRAIAKRVAAGEMLPRVAKELGITYETARTHLREVYRRLDIHGRTELRERLSPAR